MQARCLRANIYYLRRAADLSERMRVFESTGDFDKFWPHAKLVKSATESLQTRLRGRLLMGSTGGGYFSGSVSAAELANRIRQAEDRARDQTFETSVNEYLGSRSW